MNTKPQNKPENQHASGAFVPGRENANLTHSHETDDRQPQKSKRGERLVTERKSPKTKTTDAVLPNEMDEGDKLDA